MEATEAGAWPAAIFSVLKAYEVGQVAYVPDAGHTALIDACIADPAIETILLTTEEEGVALLGGAWLGGQRGVLLMQSSGLGNCMNMLSLAKSCRFPLPMLITMRGQWAEFNPWQVAVGQVSAELLRLAGAVVFDVDRAGDVADTTDTTLKMAYEGPAMTAMLIAQRLIGTKAFGR